MSSASLASTVLPLLICMREIVFCMYYAPVASKTKRTTGTVTTVRSQAKYPEPESHNHVEGLPSREDGSCNVYAVLVRSKSFIEPAHMPPFFAFGSVNLSGTVPLVPKLVRSKYLRTTMVPPVSGFCLSPVEGVSMAEMRRALALQCTAHSQIIIVGNDNYS